MQTYLLQAQTTLLRHDNILTTGTNHCVGTWQHTYYRHKPLCWDMKTYLQWQEGGDELHLPEGRHSISPGPNILYPSSQENLNQQICFQNFKNQQFGNLLKMRRGSPLSVKRQPPLTLFFSNVGEGKGGLKTRRGLIYIFMVFSFLTGLSRKELNFN